MISSVGWTHSNYLVAESFETNLLTIEATGQSSNASNIASASLVRVKSGKRERLAEVELGNKPDATCIHKRRKKRAPVPLDEGHDTENNVNVKTCNVTVDPFEFDAG